MLTADTGTGRLRSPARARIGHATSPRVWRQKIAYAAKKALAHGLYYLGLLQLWQAIVLRRRAVVLMYHRVLSDDERFETASHPGLVVSRDTFATHMAVLKKRFSVVGADEFASRMEQGVAFQDSSCLITFDDGWQDNFRNALPVLKQYALPALVFLPVSYIGSQKVFWQEALVHLLTRVLDTVARDPARVPTFRELLRSAHLDTLLDPVHVVTRVDVLGAVGATKQLARPTIEALLVDLAAELGIALQDLAETDGFIDWNQVDAMRGNAITFGSHGVDHLLLTHVSAEEARREIRGSKSELERRILDWLPTFSYPNGYLTEAIAGEVRSAGYRMAFITRRGVVSSTDDRFTIRRLNVHEAVTNTAPMFLARVVGLI